MTAASQFVLGIWTSAFAPRSFARSDAGRVHLDRWGWTLIAARWGYYSLVFTFFRDYEGAWRPFVDPPFGLDLAAYGWIQSRFAWTFGFVLMISMAAVWSGYLRLIGSRLGAFRLLNVLGPTFFLPAVLLQFVDLAAFPLFGWSMPVTMATHTCVLVWECTAAALVVDALVGLGRRDIIASVCLLMAIWIVICAAVWR